MVLRTSTRSLPRLAVESVSSEWTATIAAVFSDGRQPLKTVECAQLNASTHREPCRVPTRTHADRSRTAPIFPSAPVVIFIRGEPFRRAHFSACASKEFRPRLRLLAGRKVSSLQRLLSSSADPLRSSLFPPKDSRVVCLTGTRDGGQFPAKTIVCSVTFTVNGSMIANGFGGRTPAVTDGAVVVVIIVIKTTMMTMIIIGIVIIMAITLIVTPRRTVTPPQQTRLERRFSFPQGTKPCQVIDLVQ